jgi:hypothetical protein
MKNFFSLFICSMAIVLLSQSLPAFSQTCNVYGPTSVCTNTLVGFSTDCSPGQSNSWYINYQSVGSGGPNFEYTFTSPGTYTVSYIYTQEYCLLVWDPDSQSYVQECYNDDGGGSITVTVTASFPAPQVTIDKSILCEPSNVSLSVTNPQGGVTYTWSSTPSGYNATGANATFSNVNRATTFTVVASNGQCSQQASKTVQYEVTEVTPIMDAINAYRKRTLRGSSYIPGHYWQESATGTAMASSNQVVGTYTVTQPGNYYIRKYSTVAGCWTTASAPVNVTLDYTPPMPNITVGLHQGYMEAFLNNNDKAHILTYAKYYLVSNITGTETTTEFIDGHRFYTAGAYYIRGRDIETGTWGTGLEITAVLLSDSSLNWVHARSFDGSESNNVVVSESKSYFDDAGKPLQSQVKSLTDNKVLATESLRDRYDRVVGSTLPAPIGSTDFLYHSGFILANNGESYSHKHFDADANRENPEPVNQSIAGTLGWYYSANNPDNTIPRTSYPYSRSFFYEDGTGEAKNSIGVGDVFRILPGHEVLSGTFPVIDELNDYLDKRVIAIPGISQDGSLRYEGVQSVGRDENGKYGVSITDKSGKTVMSARKGKPGVFGKDYVLEVTNSINAQASDPTALNYQPLIYFYVWDDQAITLTGSTDFIAENIVTEEKKNLGETFINAQGNWPAGFYRITLKSGTLSLSYKNYYLDVSYQFYDDVGRLKASVSPNGFMKWSSGTDYNLIDKTTYQYNHRGWLLSMTEPDAGKTEYKYRRDGKIRFSQNALQREKSVQNNAGTGKFSYTNYDALGRPVESGEYIGSTITYQDSVQKQLEYSDQRGFAEVKDWVRTHYDNPASDFTAVTGISTNDYKQEFVRGAVSWTENENIKTYYSYDELGRVTWMAQKPTALPRTFVVTYQYDFLGNVLRVSNLAYNLQGQKVEEFYHHYVYDKDKRLNEAYTSIDGASKKLRAKYQYYLHGPLKRIELGNGVQGIDFVYNIHGWLTQINHPDADQDPGKDGVENSFRKDAFGMVLDYYESELQLLVNNVIVPKTLDPMLYHKLPGEKEVSTNAVAYLQAPLYFKEAMEKNLQLLKGQGNGQRRVETGTN